MYTFLYFSNLFLRACEFLCKFISMSVSYNRENVTFKSEAMPFGFLHSYVTQLEAWMSSFVCVSSSGVLHQVRSCEINFRSLCKAPPVLVSQWSQSEGGVTWWVYTDKGWHAHAHTQLQVAAWNLFLLDVHPPLLWLCRCHRWNEVRQKAGKHVLFLQTQSGKPG